ncbi:enoyl-CoA hydratase/isomerase family protein [Streptomyces massasporeus]
MPEARVEDQGRVRVVTLDDPARHNCLSRDMAISLAETITQFSRDDSSDVLVITGAGEASFCSGMDLRGMREVADHFWTYLAGPLGFARLDAGKPTIAAVNGNCLAGGMELAAWCDFRIAAANATFGALNRRWGVPFTDGGTQQFTRIMGKGNALYLMETGVRIDADRAQQLGLVQEVVPEGGALARALELAQHMTTYPQASLRADRQAAIRGDGLPLAEGLKLELDLTAPTAWDAGTTEGLRRYDKGDRPQAPIAV